MSKPRLAIVGLGLIGGSVALAHRRAAPGDAIVGVDRREVVDEAVARGVIDSGAEDLGAIAGADLVVLAAPVGEILRLLPRLADALPGTALVTDTGSTKRQIVQAADGLPDRLAFVGGHPMGGAAAAGLAHARADLFDGRPWILTPSGRTPVEAVARLTGWSASLGARPVTMTAAEHDRALAAVSHLPQVVASALMAVVGERVGDEGLALAGGGLRDTTRLASSPASMWADILASNADEIGPALDAAIDELRGIRGRLGDRAAVDALFTRAAEWRARAVAAVDPEADPGTRNSKNHR